jgi:hypothetical protein
VWFLPRQALKLATHQGYKAKVESTTHATVQATACQAGIEGEDPGIGEATTDTNTPCSDHPLPEVADRVACYLCCSFPCVSIDIIDDLLEQVRATFVQLVLAATPDANACQEEGDVAGMDCEMECHSNTAGFMENNAMEAELVGNEATEAAVEERSMDGAGLDLNELAFSPTAGCFRDDESFLHTGHSEEGIIIGEDPTTHQSFYKILKPCKLKEKEEKEEEEGDDNNNNDGV